MINAQLTRTEEGGIPEKMLRTDESFRRSQNWSRNSSIILGITREVQKEFRVSAASSPRAQGNTAGTQFEWIGGGLLL